ncbi:MAG TPA: winged helix-turn-helix domain-containing protein [Sedimentisphaerales bacterium]|nr:winged helix-turn-helix domain-containing protein [Sedimentisphaerales bacterium]
MDRTTRARRDFDELENRRKKATQLFRKGKRQADVARQLGVSRQSVSRWFEAWKQRGARAWRRAGSPGRNCRLTDAQQKGVERALLMGAQANGFHSNLWTLSRVARVIERQTGVRYHPGHVWRVLQKMRWSLQRPAKRAKERNPEAVEVWKRETWPELKKKLAEPGLGWSSKTRAACPRSRR